MIQKHHSRASSSSKFLLGLFLLSAPLALAQEGQVELGEGCGQRGHGTQQMLVSLLRRQRAHTSQQQVFRSHAQLAPEFGAVRRVPA